ncbi:hypothetical protein Fmac_014326 [Flemingia macrophylla]|uniref:Peptidase A1 domain-containing protein n=1 Tax=Flemingia macrophylla TaxID=520843 RepID=A0ABD1MBE7_9FABA
MVMKVSLFLVVLSIFCVIFKAYTEVNSQNDGSNDPTLTNREFHKEDRSSEPTRKTKEEDGNGAISAKLHLRKRPINHGYEPKTHILDSAMRDLVRIQTLRRKVIEKKYTNSVSRKEEVKERKNIKNPANDFLQSFKSSKDEFSGNIMATLESGASLGTGEYFIDMFIGTPPKHVWLILDTGSDLTWIQCDPCFDCFEQNEPVYVPKDSSSYRNITCYDHQCQLVSSPDPIHPCKDENQTCPYFYGYADGSNTTGDFALETFTVNLTWPHNGKGKFKHVVDVMFGCGHWNKGFFHGANGMLGLGRGPLSFSSQMQSIYGHSFSYCLTDLFSNTSTSSKLVFGEDKDLLNNHNNLNFTTLLDGEESPDDTFYYLKIKSIMVGGEVLDIPEQTWHWSSSEGALGGTIIDSGSTLTFFPDPAYGIIREAFEKRIKLHQVAEDGFVMSPCYNMSGAQQVELPKFGIRFADGVVWNFPSENYFYQYEPNEVICLAIIKSPNHSNVTIIGNLLQQNFHILYDVKRSRLGYSPMKCAEV